MKVLYFVHTYGERNGISNHVESMVKNLPEEIRWEVIAGSGSGLPFFSSLKMPLMEIWKALFSDFDVMHIHGYGNFYSYFGTWVCLLRNKPLVWTIHGYPRISGARRVIYHVYRNLMAPLIFWKASRIISVSSDILPMLLLETKKRINVIPNGVDLDFFSSKNSYRKAKFVCYVGRLDPDKMAMRLLECQSHPLLFIGPDEDGTRKKIEKEASYEGMTVEFREVQYGQMPSEYEKCRYIVLPSKYEGFPLTLLEATAMERPFISTDVGEVRSTLASLFEKPEKFLLEGNLQEKINDMEKINLEGELESARKRATTYSWKSIAVKVGAIYFEVAKKN